MRHTFVFLVHITGHCVPEWTQRPLICADAERMQCELPGVCRAEIELAAPGASGDGRVVEQVIKSYQLRDALCRFSRALRFAFHFAFLWRHNEAEAWFPLWRSVSWFLVLSAVSSRRCGALSQIHTYVLAPSGEVYPQCSKSQSSGTDHQSLF